MHRQENWDHLRYLLAVAEAGSVSQAARNLGVNHATVLRHVAAFEGITGAEIFAKSASGYSVHDDRMRVIDAVRDVETAIQAVQQIIKGARVPARGLVRVTSTDAFCQTVLSPLLPTWQNQLNGLRIELLSTNSRLDFSRLGADITVRPAVKLDDDLHGVIACELGFDVYCATGSKPKGWLSQAGSLERSGVAEWMGKNIPSNKITGSSDSFLVLREMAAVGLGQVILPCFMADNDRRLRRCPGILPNITINLWVANHVDLDNVSRIKTVRELLVTYFQGQSERMAGRVK